MRPRQFVSDIHGYVNADGLQMVPVQELQAGSGPQIVRGTKEGRPDKSAHIAGEQNLVIT